MKYNIIVICLLLFLIILYVISQKQENFASACTCSPTSNEAVQNIAGVYADISGSVNFTNMNVTGGTNMNNLNVEHNANIMDGKISNNLNVDGLTTLNNLTVSGLINGIKINTNPGKSSIYSPNGVYSLAIQDDGNLVVYKNNNTPEWDSKSTKANLNSTACGARGLALWLTPEANVNAWNFATC